MRSSRLLGTLILCWQFGFSIATLSAKDTAYTPPEPKLKVATADFDWRDESRDRVVPVRVYYPEDGQGPWPLVMFSHGLGGARHNSEYLGRHWAGCGYVSIHMQHAGSDEAVWKDLPLTERIPALKQAALKPTNFINRPLDVRFVIDKALELNAASDSVLKGKIDPEAIGLSGHSFGGHTTLAAAGQVFAFLGRELQYAEPRLKAAIQMSAPAPRDRGQLDRAYSKVTIPVLHMTGTKDEDVVSGTSAADRRIPFDRMHANDASLVIFKDGDHQIFSGRLERFGPRASSDDETFHRLILAGTTVFWDAHLKHDAAAKTWFEDGGYAKLLGDNATFEVKHATK